MAARSLCFSSVGGLSNNLCSLGRGNTHHPLDLQVPCTVSVPARRGHAWPFTPGLLPTSLGPTGPSPRYPGAPVAMGAGPQCQGAG